MCIHTIIKEGKFHFAHLYQLTNNIYIISLLIKSKVLNLKSIFSLNLGLHLGSLVSQIRTKKKKERFGVTKPLMT